MIQSKFIIKIFHTFIIKFYKQLNKILITIVNKKLIFIKVNTKLIFIKVNTKLIFIKVNTKLIFIKVNTKLIKKNNIAH